ncbi:MAG: hypothetical protein M1565_00775, partial [Actinobacteria bacterium]|nr:hypothetical protein [Actinomycetota bacterium]
LPRLMFGIYFGGTEPFRRTLDLLAGDLGYRAFLLWLLRRFPALALAWRPVVGDSSRRDL